MPPIIIASSSDCVMPGTYGLTMSGASVWPMKTLAATDERFRAARAHRIHHHPAIIQTTNCSTPK